MLLWSLLSHNATLCKEALEKKLPAQVTQCTCYCINNCDGNFLGALGLMTSEKINFQILFIKPKSLSIRILLSKKLLNISHDVSGKREQLKHADKFKFPTP